MASVMIDGMSPCRRGHRVNWATRQGTVIGRSYPNTGIEVRVQWDDRRTIDHWPAKALEKIE